MADLTTWSSSKEEVHESLYSASLSARTQSVRSDVTSIILYRRKLSRLSRARFFFRLADRKLSRRELWGIIFIRLPASANERENKPDNSTPGEYIAIQDVRKTSNRTWHYPLPIIVQKENLNDESSAFDLYTPRSYFLFFIFVKQNNERLWVCLKNLEFRALLSIEKKNHTRGRE